MKDNGVSHHIRTTNHLFCGMDEEAQTHVKFHMFHELTCQKYIFTTDYWACLSIRCISAYGWTHIPRQHTRVGVQHSAYITELMERFFLLFLLFHLAFSCITCWHQSTTDTFMSYITFTSKNVQSSSVFLYHHNAVFSNSNASTLAIHLLYWSFYSHH